MTPLPLFLPPSTGNPLRPLPWLLVPAASLAALLILAVLYVRHYVKGGKGVKTPEMLVRNVSAKWRLGLSHRRAMTPDGKIKSLH